MAGHKSIKVINDLKEGALQCPLCLDLLNDPRVLNCMHRFCRKCIDDLCLKGKTTKTASIPCPTCRQKTMVPSGGAKMLKSDFVLRDILERVQVKDNVVTGTCGSCSNTGELSKFCKDCQCVICAACVNQHGKMRVLQSHTLEDLESHHMPSQKTTPPTLPPRPKPSDNMKCPTHSNERLQHQCSSCDDKLICNTCLNSSHRNHITKSLDEVMASLKTALSGEMNQLSEKVANSKEGIKLTRAKRQEVMTGVEQGKTDIIRITQEMTASITEQSEKLVQEIEEEKGILIAALSSSEEAFETELARSTTVRRKVSQFLSKNDTDCQSIAAARAHLKELQDIAPLEDNLPSFSWIRKQTIGFSPADDQLVVGAVATSNTWIQQASWDIGLINEEGDLITGLVTMPSGKLLLSISRKTQATYAIVSVKDGSSGWKKNFSIQNFPPYTPCFATCLEKGVIITAWNHVITRFNMASNKVALYPTKVPTGSSVQAIAVDESEERVIVSHSSKNELRLFDGELNEARETTVGDVSQRFTQIFVQKKAETVLLCDSKGGAMSVNKFSGVTVARFEPPEAGTKGQKMSAKSICGRQEGNAFVLWASPEKACVIQYLACGIAVSKINVDKVAALMTVANSSGKECLVVCCGKGTFKVYSECEL